MVLFWLEGLWDIGADQFMMLFQLKESHGSTRIFSFSTWASSNIILGCPESNKDWKEELVVLEGEWAQPDVPESDLPYIGFAIVSGWSKPSPETFDFELLLEHKHIATLPAVWRHCQVLMFSDSLGRCRFLKWENFKCLAFTNCKMNREYALRDLAPLNKRNKGIRDGFYKTLSPVSDIFAGDFVAATMPNPEDLKRLEIHTWKSKAKGNPSMVKGKEIGSKRMTRKKELGRPPKGQSSRSDPLDPNLITSILAETEQTQTDPPSQQTKPPSSEQTRTPASGSIPKSPSSIDQVIDLDWIPSLIRERPSEVLIEEHQSSLS